MSHSIHHMCLSVRGVLRREKKYHRQCLKWIFDDDGKPFRSVDALLDALMNELAKGHEVIPMGAECEGFDYSGKGCPGHPAETTGEFSPVTAREASGAADGGGPA